MWPAKTRIRKRLHNSAGGAGALAAQADVVQAAPHGHGQDTRATAVARVAPHRTTRFVQTAQ